MNRGQILLALALLGIGSASAQQRGDWVLGRWQGGSYWFPGVVENRSGNQVTIAYDDGTRETVAINLVRPYDWRLGTRVQCRWKGGSDWYAGAISAISADGVTIDVAYDDGDREQLKTGACRAQ